MHWGGAGIDLLAVGGYLVAWMGLAAAAATAAGHPPAVAAIGFGPTVGRVRLGRTELRLCAFPLGASLALPPERQEEGFPAWILIAPHAALGLLGAVAAWQWAPGATGAILGWGYRLVTLAPLDGGVLRAVAAGSEAVAANPVGWAGAICATLGLINVFQGAGQGLGSRFGATVSAAWVLVTGTVVLWGLGRSVWLDL